MLDTALSADSQALLLLCSSVGLSREEKPLSQSEWNRIATVLAERGLRPGDLMGRDVPQLQGAAGADARLAERMARLLDRGGQLALELERFAARGIWALTRADERYPRSWKQRLKQAAPVVVFGAGAELSNGQRAMAIVGSRDVDEAALEFVRRLATACAQAGLIVVSGGARGTDASAVGQCLEAGGRAVVILADSLEKALRDRGLLAAVRDGQLTLMTALHPSVPFSVGAAMGRNKLIYSLSDWATVVTSSLETGGTWAGATENLQRGWVPLFVRDEHGVPEGNLRLIALGGRALGQQDIASGEALTSYVAHQWSTGPLPAPVPMAREGALPFEADTVDAPSRAVAPSASGQVDVYSLVVDRLVSFCSEPRIVDDVVGAFAIEPAQAKAWLARAVKDGVLRKRMKPVRYESAVPLLLSEAQRPAPEV